MTEHGARRPASVPIAPVTAAVCPYLRSSDRTWRASTASRDHRCSAVAPPAVLASDKQRRLCLVDEHRACSTYLAAIGQSSAEGGPPRPASRATTRPLTRTTPLVLDQGRIAFVLPAIPQRGAAQGGLVALMAVAFGALVVSRPSAGGQDLRPTVVDDGSAGPSVAGSAAPTTARSAEPVASPAATPERTLVPSEVRPSAPPAATGDPPDVDPTDAAPTSYTIKRGDTLSGVAGEFGTTWQVLAELNGITDPGRLRVGQVIQLP